jgi:hypothetical protein
MLKGILGQGGLLNQAPKEIIFAVFFIPPVFLWTSVALRESFILVEMTAFLAGLNLLIKLNNKRAFALLYIGLYGLVSTRNHLWACLMVSLILGCVIFIYQGFDRRKIVKLLVAGLLLPVIAFASTTSVYALDFIFHSNIS